MSVTAFLVCGRSREPYGMISTWAPGITAPSTSLTTPARCLVFSPGSFFSAVCNFSSNVGDGGAGAASIMENLFLPWLDDMARHISERGIEGGAAVTQ